MFAPSSSSFLSCFHIAMVTDCLILIQHHFVREHKHLLKLPLCVCSRLSTSMWRFGTVSAGCTCFSFLFFSPSFFGQIYIFKRLRPMNNWWHRVFTLHRLSSANLFKSRNRSTDSCGLAACDCPNVEGQVCQNAGQLLLIHTNDEGHLQHNYSVTKQNHCL